MSRNTLFDAKISRPELPAVYVRRRLLQALKPAPGQWAAFVTAPAGYGKTTLLASYLKTIGQPSIWYRLDASDADPATFFYYLGLAARRAAPRRRQAMPLLTADHLPSLRAFARTFFEALFVRLGRAGVLVLDDYHLLPLESPLHALIGETLSLLPKGIQVLIASRYPPPPAFAGLIANRQLRCLGWEALKLTAWEYRGILRLQGVRTPRRGLIKQLMDTTDGWVAGTIILLLHNEEPDRLDRAASERHSPGVLFDYFGNEVFQRLNRDTREFLLKTSLLSQMTAHSAEHLTGNVRAAKILAKLAVNICFTYRYRGPQEVYRYHALFRTFLLARARAAFAPEQLRTLTLRAAELEQAEQRLDAAVDLYAQAGATDVLEALVCENAAALVAQGRFSTLQGWIERIPEERREHSAWLQYWLANCLLPFDPAAAQPRFAVAFERFQAQDEPRGLLMAWSGAVDTYIYRWDRFTELDPWIAWLDEWVSRGSTFPDPVIEGHVACGMANALFFRQPYRGDLAAWFDRAWSIARQGNDPKLLAQTALSFSHVGWNIGIGAFNKSRITFDILRQRFDLAPLSPLLKLQFLLYDAMVCCLDRQPGERLASLEEALELAKASGIHHQDTALYSIEVYYALVMGDAEQAAVSLEQMAHAVQANPHLFNRAHYVFLRAWEAFLRRDRRAVEYCLAAFATAVEAGCEHRYSYGNTGLALILFDAGQVEQAWEAIDRAITEACGLGSPLGEFYALFAQAYFKLATGPEEDALAALRAALRLGREHGFVICTLWWHPDMLEWVFVTALNAGIEPEFVQASIRRRNFVPNNPPLTCKAWPWPLKVSTFGGFDLIETGQLLEFGRKTPKKPLELLKALVALGGVDVPEGTLIDALWPDSDGDTGHSAFSTTLGRLRHLVSEEFLTVANGRVSLDRRRCWTDVWAFEHLTERARAADRAGDADRGLALAEEALALYRGHFLAAEVDAVWALPTRERLRARLLALVDGGGHQLGIRHQWREAVAWYQRGLDIDPLAEAFYQGLMRAYQQLGCRAEAVQAYQRCRRTLSLSLGIKPSSATEALYRQVIDAP